MIVEECAYNPVFDLKPVDEFGWIDAAEAYVNKSVPSNLITQESDYNGIDDPDSILGKPDDVFSALRMQERIVNASSGEKSESE